MPRSQFTLRSLLWLMGVMAMVFAGWETIDLCDAAAQTGELPYFTVAWLNAVYIAAFIVLAKFRDACVFSGHHDNPEASQWAGESCLS